MSSKKSLTPNPLFSENEENMDLGEERRSLVSGELAFAPAMQMKGTDEMQSEMGALRRRTCAFTIFVLIQAAITLGVAVFAMLMMQEYGVSAGALYKTDGKLGGLKAAAGAPLHAGSSTFDNLELNSSMPNSYFSKLQRVDMSFDIPKESVTDLDTEAPSATRRGMMTVMPVPGEPQMLRHSVSALVEGFTRSPCAVCASGQQVMLRSNNAQLLIRDNVVIPFFEPKHFHGLDVENLGLRVANEQVKKLHGGNASILAGVIDVKGEGGDDGTKYEPHSANSHGRKLLTGNTISMSINHDFSSSGGSNHIDASYSHAFGHSSSFDVKASYNPGTGKSRVSAGFNVRFG